MACKHTDLKFIGIFEHTVYPEKCFICNNCGMVITDYLSKNEFSNKLFEAPTLNNVLNLK